LNQLAREVLQRNVRAVARAISRIENEHPEKEALINALYPHTGRAVVWGVTGPPGSGKSSLVNHLILLQRAEGKRVAVIAIDPSSPFSGGAVLGDRIRMQKHATDENVFIRSMASRGHLGGVAGATSDAIKVLDAAGFDLILIETIGVGQTEIDVVQMADIVLLVLVPGLGDEIQALKAGVMEIGDIFIINKSDKPEAQRVRAEVEYALHMSNAEISPIFMTSALENTGLQELNAGIEAYYLQAAQNGKLEQKRKERLAGEIRNLISAKIKSEVERTFNLHERLDEWVKFIYEQRRSPYLLVNRELQTFFGEKINK